MGETARTSERESELMNARLSRMAIRWATLGCLLASSVGCKSPREAALKAEAAAMVHAVDRVRAARHDQKAEPLAQLTQTTCTDDEVCQLKEQCSQAYGLLVKGLEQVAALKKLDSIDPKAMTMEPLLQSERLLNDSRTLALKCSEAEARLVSRFRL
jgi:hypothetical protein